MFRLSHYLRSLRDPAAAAAGRAAPAAPGPVVIWNLVRRCNLTCRHCYSTSADRDFAGELGTDEALATLHDLRAARVPVLILSGGEPLLRGDLFTLSRAARELGFRVGLSTNGTLIDTHNIDAIAACGYDYVGISLDGIGATHDRFRRRSGAFDAALAALERCRAHGIRVGVRFTLTRDNAAELPALLDLVRARRVDRFFLSHLNYAGRGNVNRRDDALHRVTRRALDTLIEIAWDDLRRGSPREYVTGNNDADGVYLLHWARRHHPERAQALHRRLVAWGGNASGERVANIDNLGNVHPDTFWWHHSLGNVRERSFQAIWNASSDPLLARLRARPRPVTGRCAACRYLAICNGNTRIRAFQATGDCWAEDPGCYLDDGEIGLDGSSRSGAARGVRPVAGVT